MAALAGKGRQGLEGKEKIARVEMLAGKRASGSTQRTAIAVTGTQRAFQGFSVRFYSAGLH